MTASSAPAPSAGAIRTGSGMCGICGIVNTDGRPVEEAELERMLAALEHRGPDGRGLWRDGPVGLGHTRLAVIDVAGGQQPLGNEDESIWTSFNGEIYNYRSLRDRLSAGHDFRTASDTEVLVHGYEEWGSNLVDELQGFFAFALWDGRQRRLLLARDGLGKKPLFFARTEQRLLFASELKAILAVWKGSPELDPVALNDVLALRYVAGRRSGIAGIERLAPGELLTLENGDLKRRSYWSPPAPRPSPMDPREALESFHTELDRAVSARLESEVPLGLLLSGGLDSTAVLESMSRVAGPPQTFTVAFSRSKESEANHARAAAQHFGSQHREFQLSESDLLSHVERALPKLDEPFGDPSFLPTSLVFEKAKACVTVCLTGDGGDELFGGYKRYGQTLDQATLPKPGELQSAFYRWSLPRLPNYRFKGWKLARRFSSALHSPEEAYVARLISIDPRTRAALLGPRTPDDLEPTQVEEELLACMRIEGDLAGRMMATDISNYLPGLILTKTDRASMASAVESRSPFLDLGLLEWAATVPTELKISGGRLKCLVRESLRGRVPEQLTQRGKQGFGTPLGRWFRHELADYLDSHLLESELARDGYLNQDTLELLVRAHRRRWRNMGEALWTLLATEVWYRSWVRPV